MGEQTMNQVLDRVIRDDAFASQVRAQGVDALGGSQLTDAQKTALVDALSVDEIGSPTTLAALARIADFEPLYRSYSATCTKKG